MPYKYRRALELYVYPFVLFYVGFTAPFATVLAVNGSELGLVLSTIAFIGITAGAETYLDRKRFGHESSNPVGSAFRSWAAYVVVILASTYLVSLAGAVTVVSPWLLVFASVVYPLVRSLLTGKLEDWDRKKRAAEQKRLEEEKRARQGK